MSTNSLPSFLSFWELILDGYLVITKRAFIRFRTNYFHHILNPEIILEKIGRLYYQALIPNPNNPNIMNDDMKI